MKIQAATKDIASWGNSILSLKTCLEEESTQKDKERGGKNGGRHVAHITFRPNLSTLPSRSQ